MAATLPLSMTRTMVWPEPETRTGLSVASMKPRRNVQVLLETPRGRTAAICLSSQSLSGFQALLCRLVRAAKARDLDQEEDVELETVATMWRQEDARHWMLLHNSRVVDSLVAFESSRLESSGDDPVYFRLKCRGRGGMDRQNRVGSKFGGGGVSSAQQSERERKDRLKRLALESIDLAKDPYLMRNHLGSYECKLCLTLHTNEANYLSHTQGKKHQQGLARRAHMEKLKQEKEQQLASGGSAMPMQYSLKPKPKKLRIGRPAYQVFKSRDSDTNQRCLSFELHFPEIEADLQPRHRFMSAFEQRVETPPDRRFQYLLFAADPYETVAFKIPNEPIDKGQDKFVTHWDPDDKKFTLTMYFLENQPENANDAGEEAAYMAGLTNPMYAAR